MKRAGFFILILFACLFACKKESRWDCFKGTGKRTTETRQLAAFENIYLRDNIDVVVIQDTFFSVKVEAGENLIPLVKTEVANNELRLSNHNRCNWARSYKKGSIKAYVTMPVLKYFRHWGSGMLTNEDTLKCDTLDILTRESGDVEMTIKSNILYTHLHGSSDVTLHGSTTLHGNFHLGEGYFHCEDFSAVDTWTKTGASGNEYYNTKNVLSVTIDWVGDVYYKGNPTINAKGNGTGKIIKAN